MSNVAMGLRGRPRVVLWRLKGGGDGDLGPRV